MEIGYALSSEEHPARDLVRYARRAEETGFTFALISDHFHPWVDRQGESPFVWSVLGGIAMQTERLRIGTGVTCPTVRTHPAIIAQAAATVETMMPGRFFLGVGTGEALNEHIMGEYWPPPDMRVEMLEEAIELIRALWTGEEVSFRGEHFLCEDARIYSLPEKPPPIYMAASGPKSAARAGELTDGFISTAPDREVIEAFEGAGGKGKPTMGQLTVCWAPEEAAAVKTAHEWWPNIAIPGELSQELPLPRHFEQAAKNVREEDIAEAVVCGPDPERHLEKIRAFGEAGFDHVYVHQVGPDQDGFFQFYAAEVLPKLS